LAPPIVASFHQSAHQSALNGTRWRRGEYDLSDYVLTEERRLSSLKFVSLFAVPGNRRRSRRRQAMASRDFLPQLRGYSLAATEIRYRLPNYPALLQLYVWQDYDFAPEFPTLRKFLEYWRRELDGPLHSVRVAHRSLIGPAEWKAIDRGFGCTDLD
jgi:uncharacterized protein Usg